MIGCQRVVDLDDRAGLEALNKALRDWEPRLELYLPPRDARLFEPDGTLYAICRLDGMSVIHHGVERPLSQGDLLVVPQALALDIEPEVVMLGLRYDGPPPDHFRERFIQVWGFEHVRTPEPGGQSGLHELIGVSDVRHRVAYATWDHPSSADGLLQTGLDCILILGLEGECVVSVPSADTRIAIRPDRLVALGSDVAYTLDGAGRVGLLRFAPELVHEARRIDRVAASGGILSPEFHPGTPH